MQVIPLEEEDMPTSHANRENNFLAFIKAQLYHGVVDTVINLLGLAVVINAMILILASAVVFYSVDAPNTKGKIMMGIGLGLASAI